MFQLLQFMAIAAKDGGAPLCWCVPILFVLAYVLVTAEFVAAVISPITAAANEDEENDDDPPAVVIAKHGFSSFN